MSDSELPLKCAQTECRLIVIGHAACALNPTYGHGMTVAAIEADLLDQFFQKSPISRITMKGHTHQLQRQLAAAHRDAWALTTYQDSRYCSAEGQQNNMFSHFMLWYSDQLQKLVVKQADVQIVMMEVMHLLKPLNALFQPVILGRVVQQLLRPTNPSSIILPDVGVTMWLKGATARQNQCIKNFDDRRELL